MAHVLMGTKVNHGKTLNIVAFTTTKNDWPDHDRLTMPAKREDALKDFEGFGDDVTKLLQLCQPDLDIVSAHNNHFRRGFNMLTSRSGPSSTWETTLSPTSQKAAYV